MRHTAAFWAKCAYGHQTQKYCMGRPIGFCLRRFWDTPLSKNCVCDINYKWMQLCLKDLLQLAYEFVCFFHQVKKKQKKLILFIFAWAFFFFFLDLPTPKSWDDYRFCQVKQHRTNQLVKHSNFFSQFYKILVKLFSFLSNFHSNTILPNKPAG